MKGTTPAGASTEREAAEWVRAMFGRVARRYDLANHLLSFNLDRYWRARTVARVRRVLRAPGSRTLDLCCGTGDLLLALEADSGGAVWGSDFCHPMLTSAAEKVSRRGFRSRVFEADALEIPVRNESLSARVPQGQLPALHIGPIGRTVNIVAPFMAPMASSARQVTGGAPRSTMAITSRARKRTASGLDLWCDD